MANVFHDISADRITPSDYSIVLTNKKNSCSIYRYDIESGFLVFERLLSKSSHFPYNFGFIPHTLSDKENPINTIIISNEEIDQMTLVQCYPVGMLSVIINNVQTNVVLSIPFVDKQFNNIKDILQLPNYITNEIILFFALNTNTSVNLNVNSEFSDRQAAELYIQSCMDLYETKYEIKVRNKESC